MSLFDQQNSDADQPEESKAIDYTYVYLICLLILVPVFFFFRNIGKEDMGLNIGICLGIFVITIRIRWDLRTRLWFWGIIAFLLALHVPLFFLIHWPRVWVPGIAFLPIALLDASIILGTVRFTEKFIVKASTSSEEA